MLSELASAPRVTGIKQTQRALEEGYAQKVFIALDADRRLTDAIRRLGADKKVKIEDVPTMRELGTACGIHVGAAVAAILSA